MTRDGVCGPDVAVIGAGIVGAACAYYLARAGLAVQLVDRAFPAAGSSGACEGNVLLWDKELASELRFAQRSMDLWRTLAQELASDGAPNIELDAKGSILVAEDEAGMAAATGVVHRLGALGVRGTVLDAHQLRAEEPAVADDLPGGALFPDDLQVEPRLATVALVEGARRHGVVTRFDTPVTRLVRDGDGRVEAIDTPTGRVAVGTVVLAAGVWSRELAATAGVDVPVLPRKGHVVVTEKSPPRIHRKLMEAAYTATVHSSDARLQIAMVAESTQSGSILLGSSRELAGLDSTVRLPVVRAIIARALRFLPALGMLRWVRSYAGLRPFSPDHLPLIGPVAQVPGLYLATGHEGAGVCLAPATGRLIADLLVGSSTGASAHPFSPDRFSPALAASSGLSAQR